VQIVFAAVWGLLVFGEIPSVLTVAGALLVVAGVLVLWRPSPGGSRAG
jgi:drug/metabolite transporter (DMT)-like permease